MTNAGAQLDQIIRADYAKLISFLAVRYGHDLAAAEDALSDAFAAALVRWPIDGLPQRPHAWLLRVAAHRLIDHARRERRTQEILRQSSAPLPPPPPDRGLDVIPDDRLRLLFACAHPAIAADSRAPLMLQAALGVPSARIAAAFLIAPASMAQRLVRVKRRIRDAGVPFEIPDADQLPARLADVLDCIYAAFGTSWDDAPGDQRGLADEALRLARMTVELLPAQAEALGLLALILLSISRRSARRDSRGQFVPMSRQDVGQWDTAAFHEGEALLARAAALHAVGRFQLEAAIQSASMARRLAPDPDRFAHAIVGLYDSLLSVAPSLGARVARAAALVEARAPSTALAELDDLARRESILHTHQPYWAVRAAALAALRDPRAADAYQRAIAASSDLATRQFLQDEMQKLETPL